jgi:hypothetical protein
MKAKSVLVAMTLALMLGAVPLQRTQASPTDYDNDAIPDRYDVAIQTPYNQPLKSVTTTPFQASLFGTGISIPAALYWEILDGSDLSVVSGEVKSTKFLNTYLYSGAQFVTKAKIRNISTLDVDVNVLLGLIVQTARATRDMGGAFYKGWGLCVSIKNLGGVAADIEALTGIKPNVYNIAQILNAFRSLLSRFGVATCSYTFAVKNHGKLIEFPQGHLFFPGVGVADRVVVDVSAGSRSFRVTGWRIPINYLNLFGLVSVSNGRIRSEAVGVPAPSGGEYDYNNDPIDGMYPGEGMFPEGFEPPGFPPKTAPGGWGP